MVPLSDVRMWDNKEGLKQVQLEEIKELYDGITVSANAEMFVCGVCHQYITWRRDNRFAHSRGEQDKQCKDRTTYFEANRTESLYRSIPAPVKLVLDSDGFHIELGFFAINAQMIDQGTKSAEKIDVLSEGTYLRSILFDAANLSSSGTEYHPIYGQIRANYQLALRNNSLPWPEIWQKCILVLVDGIALFDEESGKRIPPAGDVEVGKSYLLIARSRVLVEWEREISLQRLKQSDGICVYRVRAYSMSKEAMKFFLRYNAFLCSKPTQIIPLWPPVSEGDHTLNTDAKLIYLMQTGDASVTPFPAHSATIDVVSKHMDAKLLKLRVHYHTNLLWTARMTVLRYLYLRPAPPQVRAPIQSGKVIRDDSGRIYSTGEYEELPDDKLIINLPYDGSVQRIHDGMLTFRSKIPANTDRVLYDIKFGEVIRGFIGNDCIAEISFCKRKKKALPSSDLSTALSNSRDAWIYMPQRYSWILSHLEEGTSEYHYVAQAIRKQRIRRDAFYILVNWIGGYNYE